MVQLSRDDRRLAGVAYVATVLVPLAPAVSLMLWWIARQRALAFAEFQAMQAAIYQIFWTIILMTGSLTLIAFAWAYMFTDLWHRYETTEDWARDFMLLFVPLATVQVIVVMFSWLAAMLTYRGMNLRIPLIWRIARRFTASRIASTFD